MRVSLGGRQIPRMLQALTSVARLSFSMTLLSRPPTPISSHLPTRHPSDGLLARYRKPSAATAAAAAAARLTAAESTSTDTDWWSSPARSARRRTAVGTAGVRSPRTNVRGPAAAGHDLRLSPPRERSRSDATAYYRRLDSAGSDHLDRDQLISVVCGRPARRTRCSAVSADHPHSDDSV